MTTAKITTRSCAALVAAVTGITLPLTGLFLHLARHSQGPRNGVGHTFMMLHEVVGVVFVAAVIVHLIFNRRAFVCHCRALTGLWKKAA